MTRRSVRAQFLEQTLQGIGVVKRHIDFALLSFVL
jgi:hypothetical protein